MLYNFFGVLFYVFLIAWIIFKLVNVCFVNKNKCKDKYIEIKKVVKNNKAFQILSKAIIASFIIELIYWGVGIVYGVFFLGMSILTLGGAAYVDAGGDASFYIDSGDRLIKYFYIAGFMAYYVYFIIDVFLAKGFLFNLECYRKLKKIKNDETEAGE